MSHTTLYHIIPKTEYEKAQAAGEYTPASLASEGFIHLSTASQYPKTAERWYTGKTGLLLLEIDVSKLKHEVKYEKVYETEEPFPHLFGAMNLDAIVKAHQFTENDDKSWTTSD